ncbi:MAG: hypothetical protein FWD05_02465 [Oscillospiraceae bacterium]|nr:hypothetical protein [Oscillospiraceae bacterium]
MFIGIEDHLVPLHMYPTENSQNLFDQGRKWSPVATALLFAFAGLGDMGKNMNVALNAPPAKPRVNYNDVRNANIQGGNNAQGLSRQASDWLGPNTRIVTNSSGDKIFISADGMRKIRFDINNPLPHNNPHVHIEIFVNGRWKPASSAVTQIYPSNVPHN